MELEDITRRMLAGNQLFREQSESIATRTAVAIHEGDSDSINTIIRDLTDSLAGVSRASGEDRSSSGEAGDADSATGIPSSKESPTDAGSESGSRE